MPQNETPPLTQGTQALARSSSQTEFVEVTNLRVLAWQIGGDVPKMRTALGPPPENMKEFEKFSFHCWKQAQSNGNDALLITRERWVEGSGSLPGAVREEKLISIARTDVKGVASAVMQLFYGYPPDSPRTLYLDLKNRNKTDVSVLAQAAAKKV